MTHVAQASGFLRRARFEALYRARFGESPERTGRRGLVAPVEEKADEDEDGGAS